MCPPDACKAEKASKEGVGGYKKPSRTNFVVRAVRAKCTYKCGLLYVQLKNRAYWATLRTFKMSIQRFDWYLRKVQQTSIRFMFLNDSSTYNNSLFRRAQQVPSTACSAHPSCAADTSRHQKNRIHHQPAVALHRQPHSLPNLSDVYAFDTLNCDLYSNHLIAELSRTFQRIPPHTFGALTFYAIRSCVKPIVTSTLLHRGVSDTTAKSRSLVRHPSRTHTKIKPALPPAAILTSTRTTPSHRPLHSPKNTWCSAS